MSSRKTVVALDATVVYSLAGRDGAERQAQAAGLLAYRKKDIVGIPTPVLAETLHLETPIAKHGRLWAFDAAAAAQANRIFREAVESVGKSSSSRRRIKHDVMILATAMTNGAQILYSSDPDLIAHAKAAHLKIQVMDLPPVPEEQIELFRTAVLPGMAGGAKDTKLELIQGGAADEGEPQDGA